jgi:UDP:flavonoid glycosyltransferase YjiC (YdhE family)
MCANTVYGHVMSLRIIARLLIVRGYDVTFLTGSDFKQRIEDIGATFVSLEGLADVTEERLRQINYRT